MNKEALIALSDEARLAVRSRIKWTSTWIPKDANQDNVRQNVNATIIAQRTRVGADVAGSMQTFTANYQASRQGKLDNSAVPGYLSGKSSFQALTHEARRTGFGNCAEMARAAYEYVKLRHRNDLDFALLEGLALPANMKTPDQLTGWEQTFSSTARKEWMDYIDWDTDCISCTHVFLVLGVCWPGSGARTDMKYGEVPQHRWLANGSVVICDPWMRAPDPEDDFGTGQGRTVDLSSTREYTSFFDSLIKWSVRMDKKPQNARWARVQELESLMRNSYVKINLKVVSNNNSATKR